MSKKAILTLVACGAALGFAVCLASFGRLADEESASAAALDDYSNIHPGDYVGPNACAECHAQQHDQWRNHAHSKMNLNASESTVLGDFSGREIEYGKGRVVFHRQDGEFLISLFDEEELTREYRVTRTVGSRIEQMYIGLQTKGPEPAGDPVYSEEGKLPFGYWIKRHVWLPDSYFDSDRSPEATDPDQMTRDLAQVHQSIKWDVTCIYCHNTYPYEHRIAFGEGFGFPANDIDFPGGVEQVRRCGPTSPEKLVTLGISCESCHFGGREHAIEQRKPRYVPTSPGLKIRGHANAETGSAKSAYVINAICSQCHCAKITLYPNGAGTWNSREALDLTSGACASELKCTDCHDPHLSGHAGGMLAVEQIVNTCLRCHGEFRDETKLADHTRHQASDQVNCLDCHMPKIVQGLEEVVRSHHIGSPTDENMLRRAAPNACNLCHLDRSIEWTLSELQKGWGRRIERDLRWDSAYGDLSAPVGRVWLDHKVPVVRLVASAAYARSPIGEAELPNLAKTLDDPYAVNRMFGLFAVEQVLSRRLTKQEYDPLAPAAVRREQTAALIERFQEQRSSE